MKNQINSILIAIILMLASVNSAIGQEEKKKKMETVSAISIGTTYSNLSDNDGKPKVGLSAGLYNEYKLLKHISFTTEILYNQRGERSNDEFSNIRLHYIDFPLMVRFNILKDKVGLSTGMITGIQLGSNKVKNTFQRFDSAIPIVLNYSFVDYFQLSLKYNIGIRNIPNEGYVDQEIKSNWFGVSLLLVSPK